MQGSQVWGVSVELWNCKVTFVTYSVCSLRTIKDVICLVDRSGDLETRLWYGFVAASESARMGAF